MGTFTREVVLGFGSKSSQILNFRGLELLISSSKLYCSCEQLWLLLLIAGLLFIHYFFSFEDLLNDPLINVIQFSDLSVLFIFKDVVYTQLHY